jgi:hypothetical protein
MVDHYHEPWNQAKSLDNRLKLPSELRWVLKAVKSMQDELSVDRGRAP